ncbi:MAG: hypothetical protein ABEJ42_07205 [Halobacteriaceae archaeon]
MSGPSTPDRDAPAGGGPGTDRGQAHTLEAFAAATLLLASVLFALQVTAVTPLTASTSSQHIENQQAATAEGVLRATDDADIRTVLRNWDSTRGEFWGSDEGFYVSRLPSWSSFGDRLERAFDRQGVAYNVNLYYVTQDGTIAEQRLLYTGEPSDHAAAATTTVALRDSDKILGSNGGSPTARLDAVPYFAPDAYTSGSEHPLYNVVVVEVVVWRM